MLLLLLIQAAAPANPTVVVQGSKPEKPICRYSEDTGSRMSRTRTCHTRSEWRALETPLGAGTINNSLNTAGVAAGMEVPPPSGRASTR